MKADDPKEMSWAQEYRMNWIDEMLRLYGFINRRHIMMKFRVSVPQANADLSVYKKLHAETVHYDASAKVYRLNS